MRHASRAAILSLFSFCCLSLNAFASQTALPPGLSLPDAGLEPHLGSEYYGALKGNAGVSASGNAQFSIPITAPPARGGLTPNISLSYSSAKNNGRMGIGWSLSILEDRVERCAQNLAQDGNITAINFSSTDRYCLNGQRLMLVSGSYGGNNAEYRTESDRFQKITSHGNLNGGPEYFKAVGKNQKIKFYGSTPLAKTTTNPSGKTIFWNMDRVEDLSGNYYRVEYRSGRAYKLHTSNNDVVGGVHWNNYAVFNWSGRPDMAKKYVGGEWYYGHSTKLTRFRYIRTGQTYNFGYEETAFTNQTRLTSVQYCSKSKCLLPIELQWKAEGAPSYVESQIVVPHNDTISQTCDRKQMIFGSKYPRWHDFNGDGKSDYVNIVLESSDYQNANMNGVLNRDSFEYELLLSSPTGHAPATWVSESRELPHLLRWMDLNRDGKTDVISLRKDSDAGIQVALSTGSGFDNQIWAEHVSNATTVQLGKTYPITRTSYDLVDVDADLLPDLIASEHYTIKEYDWGLGHWVYRSYVNIYVHKNTGTDFGPAVTWIERISKPSFVDLNGDRLIDLLDYRYGRLNTGSDFTGGTSSAWFVPDVVTRLDENSDGLQDVIATEDVVENGVTVQKNFVFYNTGKGFEKGEEFTGTLGGPDLNGDGAGDSIRSTYTGYTGKSDVFLDISGGGSTQLLNDEKGAHFIKQFTDVNGDGLLDYTFTRATVCQNFSPGTPGYYGLYNEIWAGTGEAHIYESQVEPSRLIERVNFGLDNFVEFNYKSIRDPSVYTKGQEAIFPEQDVQSNRYVVTKIARANGLGGTFDSDYKYEGLKANLIGRGSLGFKKIIVENQTSGITTETSYAQEFPLVSRALKVERFETSTSRLLSRSDTEYNIMGVVGSGPVFPYVTKHTQQNYELSDGRLLLTAITNNIVDTYGNVTATDTVTADHETGITFNSQSSRQYTIDLVNWRIGQLNQQTQAYGINGVMDANFNRTTEYQYYPNGLLKRTLREPGAGAPLELTVDYAYNDLGFVTQKTVSGAGVVTRSLSTEYDAYSIFPIKVTNALGHETSSTWDYSTGKPKTQTDPNGLTTSITYNYLGQAEQANLPDGTNVKHVMRLDNSGQNPGAKFYTEVIPTGKPAQRTFYDMLGRPIRTRSQSFDGSFVQQDTQYDIKGRAFKVSEPYFVGDSITWNTTSFDALGRVDQIDAADNTNDASLSYDGFKATLTDVNNRQSSSRTDVRGAIVEAIDRAGTKTQFAYNAAGLRTSVTNAVGLTKQFSVNYQYDRLGRMTQQDDPSHGIYTYEYDALGQKLKEVSPKMYAAAQSIQFEYDLLGRMTSRTEPEGTTSWSFDNIAAGNLGIGRLHEESMVGFTRGFEYGAGQFGRATAVNTQILQAQYRESMTYDANGNVDTLTYPSSHSDPNGFKVRYEYNDLGFVERLTNDSSTETYYQMVGADAAGRITQQWLGDGSSQSQVYEINSNRLSSQQTTAASGTTVQSFLYQYDTAGNMVNRQDTVNSLSEVFTFDNLDRLTSAKVGSHTTATYGFDAVDNIVSKSDVGIYGYSAQAANAVSETVLAGQTNLLNYDPNGNFFAGNAMPTVTWASYNKPLSLNKNGSSYAFKYGPSRQRYRQEHQSAAGTKITHYVGSNFEVVSNGPKAEYRHLLRANGRVVMMRRDVVDPAGNAIKHEYLHRDHLGSITAVTKEDDGSAVATMSYDAWGKRRDATDWNSTYQASAALGDFTRGYTGHEHLDDVGIIHMNGRVYSAELGKMMSPDPVTAEPDGGRNYNRYTYAYNNPLRYVDLNGYEANDVDGFMTVLGKRVVPIRYRPKNVVYNNQGLGRWVGPTSNGGGKNKTDGSQEPDSAADSPEAEEEDSPSGDQEDVPKESDKIEIDCNGDSGTACVGVVAHGYGDYDGGEFDNGKKSPPLAPKGVDIDANIAEAQGAFSPWWFRGQVQNGGPWDFKQKGSSYEDFGNFHYGAVGAAFGFPDSVLLNEAGRAQNAAGTSLTIWGSPGPHLLPSWGTGSYGDDPTDQYWILQGIDYYNNTGGWNKPIQLGPY